jgi:sulfur transfer complex TusBCD TusB component (DsrH family)
METHYVMIENRDPFDSADATTMREMAADLATSAKVTVYLAENGVLAARHASTAGAAVTALTGHATVWADDFSLRERGIRDDELAGGVERASLGPLVDLIAEPGTKVFWH